MPFIDPLESRTHFSADPVFEMTKRGTLVVHGTADSDNINVVPIHDNPLAGFRVTVEPESVTGILHEFDVPYRSVKRFRIEGGDGGDTIDFNVGFNVTRPATLLGQMGDDTIAFFSAGLTLADGGDGNDLIGNTSLAMFDVNSTKNRGVINDFNANDTPHAISTLLGNDGDDTLVGDSNDQIDGGNGNDTGEISFNVDVGTLDQIPRRRHRPRLLRSAWCRRIGSRSGQRSYRTVVFVLSIARSYCGDLLAQRILADRERGLLRCSISVATIGSGLIWE